MKTKLHNNDLGGLTPLTYLTAGYLGPALTIATGVATGAAIAY